VQKPAHALVAPEYAHLQQVRQRFHLVRDLEGLLANAANRGRNANLSNLAGAVGTLCLI
jgi:hypothetical protein